MTTFFMNRPANARSRADAARFIPLLLVLALIAVVSALQGVAAARAGGGAVPPLLPMLVSRLVYYLYFGLLAAAIHWLSSRIVLTRRTALRWSAAHCAALVSSFLVHEALSVVIDEIMLGIPHPASLVILLFNTPAVWIETFAYVIFLLGFSLLEYHRLNRENEIKCAELEARLTKTKLHELRNTIRPTFLFDTLHSILVLVRAHRNEDANRVLSLLSDFLRTTVYDAGRDETTLGEELRSLNHFIEIETARLGLPRPGTSAAPGGDATTETA